MLKQVSCPDLQSSKSWNPTNTTVTQGLHHDPLPSASMNYLNKNEAPPLWSSEVSFPSGCSFTTLVLGMQLNSASQQLTLHATWLHCCKCNSCRVNSQHRGALFPLCQFTKESWKPEKWWEFPDFVSLWELQLHSKSCALQCIERQQEVSETCPRYGSKLLQEESVTTCCFKRTGCGKV